MHISSGVGELTLVGGGRASMVTDVGVVKTVEKSSGKGGKVTKAAEKASKKK